MKDFMFIFRGGDDVANQSPEKFQAEMQRWFSWIERLTKDGHYTGGEALEAGGKIVHSKAKVTDGPFAEGKELVGGYFLVKAKDLDHACQLAKDCPGFDFGGTVEVRPVQIMK